MLKPIWRFCQKNMVLTLAVILAGLTMFWVPPSAAYLDYLDGRILSILFCLMLIIAGLREQGAFVILLHWLLLHLHTVRQLAGTLILGCFFISMLVTNDVALLTFVPFAVLVLRQTGNSNWLLPILVLQTVAANLGSMCTPIGNPQNLYLYLTSNMDLAGFIRLVFPYSLLSLLLLLLALYWFPGKSMAAPKVFQKKVLSLAKRQLLFWLILFSLCLLTVLHVLDHRMTFALIVLAVGAVRRRLFRQVDFTLLATFVFFFILVGNLKKLSWLYGFLAASVGGHEFLISLAASQLISNVPAAMLLSGFTKNYPALILGTDIGGLGTLIASMASLITYKFYSCEAPEGQLRYLAAFTLINLLFLLVLAGTAYLMGWR